MGRIAGVDLGAVESTSEQRLRLRSHGSSSDPGTGQFDDMAQKSIGIAWRVAPADAPRRDNLFHLTFQRRKERYTGSQILENLVRHGTGQAVPRDHRDIRVREKLLDCRMVEPSGHDDVVEAGNAPLDILPER